MVFGRKEGGNIVTTTVSGWVYRRVKEVLFGTIITENNYMNREITD